jgi:DNA-binding NtrC family response regulator
VSAVGRRSQQLISPTSSSDVTFRYRRRWADASGGVFLAIDADRSVLDNLRAGLVETRIAVETHRDVLEGILRVSVWRPHVLLVDMNVCGVATLDLCRLLAISAHALQIKVILMGARVTADVAAAGYRAGAHRILTKPITPALVGLMVGEVDTWHLPDEVIDVSDPYGS